MRAVLVVMLFAVTTTALADDKPCSVRVVRAPEQVRAAVEARIGIESGCATLDVRVVPTKDGYYVVATPPRGSLLEANVRDAGLVGELVTGWARMQASAVEEEDDDDDEEEVVREPASATAPKIADKVDVVRPARSVSDRDFAVGATATSNAYGLRAEVDIVASHGWSLGLAAAIAGSTMTYGDATQGVAMDLRDLRGVVIAAKTFGEGPWRVRAQAGFGVIQTEYTGRTHFGEFEMAADGDGATRMCEAGVTASRDIATSWAFSIGPLVTYYDQTFTMWDGVSEQQASREYDVGAYAALRKRL